MNKKKIYSNTFLLPTLVIFSLFFLIPLIISLYFSLTVWDFQSFRFVGLDNFKMFFSERSLNIGIRNTLIYAILTSGLKVTVGFFLAVFLTSGIRSKNLLRTILFFPNLVSTIAVGITFSALLHPTKGLVNQFLETMGFDKIDFLGNISTALYAVIGTDVWKGVGVATVIYIAGVQAIDKTYYEAAAIDGASKWQLIRHITFPLVRPAMNSVIMLSFISGMRFFDLIWSMTGGGPGFATDVMSSIVYKQYAAGFYGLSTAGNVIMFVMIGLIAFPLQRFLLKKGEE